MNTTTFLLTLPTLILPPTVYSIHSILYSIPCSIHFTSLIFTLYFCFTLFPFSFLASLLSFFFFLFFCLSTLSLFTNSPPFHSPLEMWVYSQPLRECEYQKYYMKGVTIVIHETILVEVNVQAVLEQTNFITNNPYMLVVTDQVSNGGVITFVIPFEESLIGYTGPAKFLKSPYINNGVFSGYNYRLVTEPKKATK